MTDQERDDRIRALLYKRLGVIPVCDFCCVQSTAWTFLTDRHETQLDDMPVIKMSPDWAACDTCKGLIEADKREELLDRSFSHMMDRDRKFNSVLPESEWHDQKQRIKAIHDGFWKHLVRREAVKSHDRQYK